MKGLFYIVGTVLLIMQSSVSGLCKNSIISENNYIKQKSYFKQARCKPVSSYVKKAKKLHILTLLMPVDFDSEKVNGDDLGGDDKWENSREDDLSGTTFSFVFFAANLPGYFFSERRYNSFIKFHIPPPK